MPEITFPTWNPASKATVITAIDSAKTALDGFLVNLTPDERKTLFKAAEGRDVFMQKAATAIHTYSELMPDDVDVDLMDNAIALRSDLDEIIINLMPLWEGINDAIMLAGAQELNVCNTGYSHLKIAAKGDAAIDTLVQDMGITYKPGPKQPATRLSIPVSASIAQKGIKPGIRITNLGETVIACRCPVELVGTVKEFEDIDIEPGNSFKLPKGVSGAILENKSATKAGLVSFLLK